MEWVTQADGPAAATIGGGQGWEATKHPAGNGERQGQGATKHPAGDRDPGLCRGTTTKAVENNAHQTTDFRCLARTARAGPAERVAAPCSTGWRAARVLTRRGDLMK